MIYMSTVIDKDFGVIIIDDNPPIYKYFGNYYVLIDDQYLAFRPVGEQDDINYTIIDNAPVPFNSKIDYSKSVPMQGITSIMFGQDGNNPNLENAQLITMPIPALPAAATPLAAEPEPSIGSSAATPEPAIAPDTESEPEADDGEVLDINEEDLDDILDMFAAGEVTNITMVRGIQVQTFDVNVTRIKSLLETSDNEFLNEVQSQFLINMQKIAEQRSKNATVGQLMLNVKGLPNWIVPVVKGAWTPVERAYEEVKQDSFQVETTPGACNMTLDLVNEPLYTGYAMDTDRVNDLPGSWRKSRTDFTVNAAYMETDRTGSSSMRLIKLPGNSYETNIKLTETAVNRILNNRNKNASMYARMITLPKSISSIDVDLIGTERTASVVGLLVRAPGSSTKALSSTQDKFVELKCSSMTSHKSVLEQVLTEVYPSVDQVINGWADTDNVFTEDFFKLFKKYQYDRADLTKANWSQIGEIIKRNLKAIATDDWATQHTETVNRFKRVKDLEPKDMQPADNGKFILKSLLDDYLVDIQGLDTALPEAQPGTPVKLTVNNARYNSIMLDPVHGLVFRSVGEGRDTGKFYTADEYRKQLRYQLMQRLQVNLDAAESERSGMTSETLRLILADLETYRWTANKGILDSLKIKLTTSNTVASSTLNMLNRFDLTDIAGQVSYIRHMTMFIEQGLVKLDPISKKYYIVQSQERVCCEHEFEDIKEQPLTDFIGREGKCKYCGAQLVHLDQADDYGQTQFMTMRDMYTAQGDEIPDTDPDFATLSYFIEHAIKYLEPYLSDRGIVLSSANHEQIKEDTIAYIKEHDISAAKPYGSIISSPPKGGVTPDLRLAVLYGLPINTQQLDTDDGKSERTAFRFNEKGNPVATVAFSRILAYFRDAEADSTTDTVPIIFKKLKRGLISQLATEKSFTMLHNMLVLNRLCYCYGAMVAQMNLTVNMDYSNTDVLMDLMDDTTIYNICNTFNTRMTVILSQHIQNLNTGAKEGQIKIMPYFEAYIRMFSADFSRDLYNVGLTSQTVDGVMPVDQRALRSFATAFEQLKRQNAEMYDRIGSREVGFAKYEATHSMVAPITATVPRAPDEIENMQDYMDCWAVNMHRGSMYGDRLWKQYATINRSLDQVPYESGGAETVAQYLMKLTGSEDDKSLEATTFQASVCSSTVLLNGPILEEKPEVPDEVMEAYLTNERTLSDFKKSNEANLDLIDQELCEFNLAVPAFNKSLQTNLTYHPCNPTPKGLIKAEIMGQKPDVDETLRKEFQSPTLLKNMRMLVNYNAMTGYTSALDGVIFNKRGENGAARMNYLTNDIEVNLGSEKTITNSEAHSLVVNRRFTVGLADSLKEPEDVDEIPGFDDDFPKLIKPEAQLMKERKQTINRRRIFRIQNNGRALKSLLGWMSTPMSAEVYDMLKSVGELSESTVTGSRYAIEKELASMEGYRLMELLTMKWSLREKIPDMNLTAYEPVIPEIYSMSYVEYTKIMDKLDMPNEKNLSSFRDMIFAAIRLDIIVHVKRLSPGATLGVKFDLTPDLLQDIHDFGYGPAGNDFTKMVTRMFDALAKINIDPNVESINRLYEARLMERITISMAAQYKAKTGFEMPTTKGAEQLTGENDPDLENPENEADADGDGQPDESDVEGDNGEDEFDDEELAGMVEGEIERD